MEMRKGHSVVAVMQTEIIQCFAHPLACHLAMSGSLPCLPSHFWTTPHERWHKTIHSRRNFEVVSSGIPAGSCRLCLDDFDHMPDLSHLPKRASLFWPMNINKLCWIAEGKPSGWLAVGIPAGLALPRPLNSSQLQGKSVETCGDSLHAIL